MPVVFFYLLLVLVPPTAAAVRGTVKDALGAPVVGAKVDLQTSSGEVLAVVMTDTEGRFEWHGVGAAIVSSGTSERAVIPDGEIELLLAPASLHTRVTVTARRGAAEEADESQHVVVIKDNAAIASRPAATLGNAFEREPGIMVQQSTYGQVSPFLRGLTGYHVLNVIDGVRFNNSTFRSGPNQYLAFVEPMQAQRVEALLGPTGSQYGSDALGGTIQVLTPEARFASARGWETHGQLQLSGATADWSGIGGARLSLASERLFWLGGVSGRKHNDFRAGRGLDSRNAFYRFLGMPLKGVRDLLGSRQQDTGFRQYGLQTKLAWRPREGHIATLNYQRGVQADVRGYKDLLGGLGRMLSTFEPQLLNWFHGRYEKLGLSALDSLSGTFSWNSQTDGSRRQNLRLTDPITEDVNRVNAYGYTGQGTAHWASRLVASFGGEIYDERIRSRREVTNPVDASVSRPRPLYPDRSQYQNLGLFSQAGVQLTSRLRASGGLRFTAVRFHTVADSANGIPDSSQWFRDVTFHASARYQVAGPFGIHAVVSRGFRAPNLNDLGALGLNDLGYEVPSSSARDAGALLSTDSGESAIAKGAPLGALAAESLLNYEFGARVNTSRLYARVQLFDAELADPIVRRTLLFPVSNTPASLAGLPVTPLPQTAAQQTQGVVAVATAIDPRAVKSFVNDGSSRYYGLEALTRYSLAHHWTLEANYTYLLGRDLNPNRNIRRLPPQSGTVSLRHAPSGRRPWWEISVTATGAQHRLSGGDRDDERIGASRNLQDIAAFFAGSRVAPYLNAGFFTPTGETLAQIQSRVLPGATAATRVPLYLSTAGWTALNLRGGYPLSERLHAMAAWDNLLDRNYRVHGSGMDSPGRSAYLGLSYSF
ncbi:MAG TPA: TonB-dependent receptor [Bryobacteraceae bacterium]|nr:TonB-dependent receptor [Bryobacteraceae bacterium]